MITTSSILSDIIINQLSALVARQEGLRPLVARLQTISEEHRHECSVALLKLLSRVKEEIPRARWPLDAADNEEHIIAAITVNGDRAIEIAYELADTDVLPTIRDYWQALLFEEAEKTVTKRFIEEALAFYMLAFASTLYVHQDYFRSRILTLSKKN